MSDVKKEEKKPDPPANNNAKDTSDSVPYQVAFNFHDPELQQKYHYRNNEIRTSKYTLLTFWPINFYGQFKKYYNLYFLLGACLTAFKDLVTVDPFVQIFPLCLVVSVSALKDAIEDIKRHQEDRKLNNIQYKVLRNNAFIKVLNRDIMPGDLVYIQKGELFPADLVLLASCNADGSCFIETSNLDGETNLKRKQALEELNNFAHQGDIEKNVQQMLGRIQADAPNDQMNAFTGRLLLEDHSKKTSTVKAVYPLNLQHVLLRGARLRNTDFIIGVVIYSGLDTKIFKNLKNTGLKSSRFEGLVNIYVAGIFVFNFIILVLTSLFAAIFEGNNGHTHWYLGSFINGGDEFGESMISFFVLYSYMIPLSLFVSLEIARVIQGQFMEWDEKMKLSDGNQMKVKNSGLNEELGNVEFVFSDKTGTLTQNEMRVTHWYVNGHGVFPELSAPGMLSRTIKKSMLDRSSKNEIAHFARHLATCHAILPSTENGITNYESQSPDDLALLLGLKGNDILLTERTKNKISFDFMGSQESYEILNTLEFNSDRKRMSVIVRTANGIELYCKGADSIILSLLHPDSDPKAIKEVQRNLDIFALQGLRTLAVSYKRVAEEEYKAFEEEYVAAERSLVSREEKIDRACEIIEKNMTLLGATAIEDRLQDEVPETIEYILKAGIKFWLLTGDKLETAVNIGMSSKLLNTEMEILRISCKSSDECVEKMKKYYEETNSTTRQISLVIDGFSLTFAMSPENEDLFVQLCFKCHAVICCRVTPLQKALVVRLVRKKLGKITLSIGDGANDVSMIQEAHVGVGIYGKEGGQACRASDFYFTQFRFLKRLLFVHGRYNNLRLSKLTLYSFYKNMAMIMVQFLYGIYNAWSGDIVYDSMFLSWFNAVFTSLGPLCAAIFEKDVSEEAIDKYPLLYGSIRKGVFFDWKKLVEIMALALVHSTVIFFLSYGVLNDYDIWSSGIIAGYNCQTIFFSSMIYLVVYYKIFLVVRYNVIWTAVAYLLSALIFLLNMFLSPLLFYSIDVDRSIFLHKSPSYYFSLILIPVVAIIPDVCLKMLKKPTDAEIVEEEYRFKTDNPA